MKERENTATSCDDCADNKMSCKTCKNISACKGCKVCGTLAYEMCPHCDINCVYESVCGLRNEWIKSMAKKADFEGKLVTGEFCTLCPWEYACTNSSDGICPGETWSMQDTRNVDVYNAEVNKEKKFVAAIENHKEDKKKKQKIYKYKANNNDGVWDSGISCIDACPHTKGVCVNISADVYYKLRHLQDMFRDVEFTVYANAEKNEDGTYYITDIVIPKQKVGMASVDDIEIDGHYNTIIHKHPGDSPGGFSHVDKEYANSNHDFSILIGSTNLNNIIGAARILTECKKYMRVPIEVKAVIPPVTDTFFLESTKNIEKKEVYTSYYSQGCLNVWEEKRKDFYGNRWD